MQTLVPLCTLLLLLFSAQADVVKRFEDNCSEFFYNGKVPKWKECTTPTTATAASASASATTTTASLVCLCQRYGEGDNSRFHFATLYDTTHRIAVYSAYIFQPPTDDSLHSKTWFIEPQLVDTKWKGEMEEERYLPTETYLGEKQALNEDYKDLSGFNRGHLNPNGHHSDTHSRAATYTLTNVVPQNIEMNREQWAKYEKTLIREFESCSKAFVLVGAIPSEKNWIKNRVNIPDFLWNAYCCVDNNDKPIKSGAAKAKNSKEGKVEKLSLDQLKDFLKISKEAEGALFDKDCGA